jgi:diguanylate cyclase (GGDEF)-like protein
VNETTTVLIADDSIVVRTVVRSRLEDEGYQVTEAEDGTSAIAQSRESPPDVILLDVEMPGLSGHEVLAQLKSDEALRNIPVVFLTARTSMEDVLTGLRGGAHDYLKKPFEPAELVARVGSAAHVKKLQDRLLERNEELERVSRTDTLTGLYNRRHLQDELVRNHASARRNGTELGVVLMDIDHFKKVNDTYGHAAGDEVLREFARRLLDQLRAGDIAGRWGGEEFLIILPNTDLDGTKHVAERIRIATADGPTPFEGRDIEVTISGGCTVGPASDPDVLVSIADTQMYLAKESGRNRVLAIDNLSLRGVPVSPAASVAR